MTLTVFSEIVGGRRIQYSIDLLTRDEGATSLSRPYLFVVLQLYLESNHVFGKKDSSGPRSLPRLCGCSR